MVIAAGAMVLHASAQERPMESANPEKQEEVQMANEERSLPVDKINLSGVQNQLVNTEAVSHISEMEHITYVRITTYGVDCYGCYEVNGFGGSASGVGLSFDAVQQSDGSWKPGITYDGYYVIAANSSIPMGSIVEISNHGYNGMGLREGVPFRAIVLDRGAMTLNHVDLFVGSEASPNVSVTRGYAPTMEIIRYGF